MENSWRTRKREEGKGKLKGNQHNTHGIMNVLIAQSLAYRRPCAIILMTIAYFVDVFDRVVVERGLLIKHNYLLKNPRAHQGVRPAFSTSHK